MKVTIEKDIDCCDDCPYAGIGRTWTKESWGNARKISCKKLNRIVHNHLSWRDDSKIPEDCPFRKLFI